MSVSGHRDVNQLGAVHTHIMALSGMRLREDVSGKWTRDTSETARIIIECVVLEIRYTVGRWNGG